MELAYTTKNETFTTRRRRPQISVSFLLVGGMEHAIVNLLLRIGIGSQPGDCRRSFNFAIPRPCRITRKAKLPQALSRCR